MHKNAVSWEKTELTLLLAYGKSRDRSRGKHTARGKLKLQQLKTYGKTRSGETP